MAFIASATVKFSPQITRNRLQVHKVTETTTCTFSVNKTRIYKASGKDCSRAGVNVENNGRFFIAKKQNKFRDSNNGSNLKNRNTTFKIAFM